MTTIAAVLTVSAILLYTGQGFFNKLFSISHPGRPVDVTPAFNILYGGFVAAGTLIYSGFSLRPDWISLALGLINGAALFFYNESSIHAAQSGPYTLQSMMISFGGILPPMAVSLTVWGDRLTWVQALGIALMLAAFALYNFQGGKEKKQRIKGLFWFFMVFAANGVFTILTDAHQRLETGAHRNDFIFITFITAALISALSLLLSKNQGARQAFRMPGKALAFALLSSLCATVAIHVQLVALNHVPSSLLYPIENGGLLVAHTLLSVAILKEKPRPVQYLGIAAAVAGLVLTNL